MIRRIRSGRRLDPLLPQVRQQFRANAVRLPLLVAHLDGQPVRGLVGIRERALPKPEVPPDIPRCALIVRPSHLTTTPARRENVHQPRHVGDRLIGDLRTARREPAMHLQRSAASARTPASSHPADLTADSTPPRPASSSPRARPRPAHAPRGIRLSHEAGSQAAANPTNPVQYWPRTITDARRSGKIPHRHLSIGTELGGLSRVYLVARVLPTPRLVRSDEDDHLMCGRQERFRTRVPRRYRPPVSRNREKNDERLCRRRYAVHPRGPRNSANTIGPPFNVKPIGSPATCSSRPPNRW